MVDITTKDDEFGVVKAFCKRCRFTLEKKEGANDNLSCPSCGHREQRKLASDYGNVSEM